MVTLFLMVLSILIAIGFIALLYYIIIWALGQFGIPVPEVPLKIALVILVLMVIYMIVSGSFAGFLSYR